jgi:hypothetical protein
MGYPATRPRGLRKRAWWGAAAVALVAAGMAVRLSSATENTPAAVAERFVYCFYTGCASEAVGLMAKSPVPGSQMESLIHNQVAELKAMGMRITRVTAMSVEVQGSTAHVGVRIDRIILGFSDSAPMPLELVKLNGQWKVLFELGSKPAVVPEQSLSGKPVPLDLTPFINGDLTAYTNGAGYPGEGGPLKVAGVTFNLARNSSGHTAIFQSPGDAPSHLSIPVHIRAVTTVYTLINSAYGSCGSPVGELEFIGAASGPFVYRLTEGLNIRDHGNGQFCNNVTDIAGSAKFGGGTIRLDMQKVTLPASFASDTLAAINFKTFGKGVAGAPFLAGITVIEP